MPLVTPPAISPLPTPPSSSDPANFDTRADAFLGALPGLQTEANALAQNLHANAAFATLNLPGSGTAAATTDPDGAASRNSCPPRSSICTADTV